MELTLIFYAIQIAKSFYDHGRFDVFKKAFPQHILREDSFYELQEPVSYTHLTLPTIA